MAPDDASSYHYFDKIFFDSIRNDSKAITDWYILWRTLKMHMILNAFKQTDYLGKHHIFVYVGKILAKKW